MKKPVHLLIILLCMSSVLLAQAGEEAQGPDLALKITSSIEIDGRLEESAWGTAPDADAYLARPEERDDAQSVRTTVKILFDQRFLYLGFLCHDDHPEQIFAEISGRDSDLRDDDSIYVLLESRTEPDAYVTFMTNALGTLTDGLVSLDGRVADPRWNGAWRSAGMRTDSGWSAELAIDLTELGYEANENIHLGMKLARVVPRLDSLFRKGPLDPAFTPQDMMVLPPLNLLRSWKRLSAQAHLLGSAESGGDTNPAAGAELRYALSQSATAVAVIQPDFTDVEPDLEQVNLTVFELDIPEKRTFFSEGRDYFDTRFRLFHSKRIGDINGGVRMQGRSGALQYAGMSVFSKADDTLGLESANTSTIRVSGDLFRGFSLGVTAANRRSGGSDLGAASVDARMPLFRGLSLEGQFAYSYGEYDTGNLAFYLGPKLDTPTTHAHLFYSHIGDRFQENVNLLGFIPDDNRREIDAAFHQAFLFKSGVFEQIRYLSNYDIYWGMDDTLRRWWIDQGLFIKFKSQWLFRVHHIQEYILNEGYREPQLVPGQSEDPLDYVRPVYKEFKDFRNQRTIVSSGMDKGEGNRFILEFTMGRNFDLDFQMMKMSKEFKASNSIFGEFSFYNLNYSEEARDFRTTTIIVFRADFLATDNLRLRTFFQYNKHVEKRNLQAYVIYRILGGRGTVQLGYQKGTAPFGQAGDQGHTALFKMSYRY